MYVRVATLNEVIRELKKLQRLLQRERHFIAKLCSSLVFCDYSMLVTLLEISEVSFHFFERTVSI